MTAMFWTLSPDTINGNEYSNEYNNQVNNEVNDKENNKANNQMILCSEATYQKTKRSHMYCVTSMYIMINMFMKESNMYAHLHT